MHGLRAAALGTLLVTTLCGQQLDPADIVQTFAPYDLDGDGRAEVERLAVGFASGEIGKPLVVVMVEGRLWRTPDTTTFRWSRTSPPPPTLQDLLRRFAADIAADGHRVLLVAADVHAGPPHQDGRTVLAMRQLFRRLRAAAPMAGAVLVGHFPDALLVRTCNWRRNENLSLPGKDGKPVAFDAKTTTVRCIPEIVAPRCDIVLADLDGDWERVYVPGPATLVAATAVFGDAVPDAGGPCLGLATSDFAVIDAFHVRDGAAIADQAAFALHLDPADRDRECSVADRAFGNPLAQPEIAVSRIDAWGVAWDVAERWFDHASDFRRTSPIAADTQPPFAYDEQLEVSLLAQYLDRNHRFRTEGVAADQRLPASIAHGLGSGMAVVRAGDAAWADFAAPGYDLGEGTDLLALDHWLQRPAVLRTLRAHSNPWLAAFAATDPEALTRELGLPAHWVQEGARWLPSWRDHRGGRADFTFFQALYEHGAAQLVPYLLLHTGCEALAPPSAVACAYDDPQYGRFAHGESILFFTACVAMVGRAKVFYDEPREFVETLAAGRTFGEAWQRYFAVERAASDWREVGDDIGRKRSYFWSMLGDWTLRLPRAR